MDENKGQKSNRRQAPVSGVEGEKRHAQASQGRAPRTASANRGENDIDRGMAPPKARGHQNRASRSDSARRSETVEKPRRARRSPNNAIAQAPQTAEKQHRSPHRHDERPCTEKSAHGHREHQDAEQKRSRATRNPRDSTKHFGLDIVPKRIDKTHIRKRAVEYARGEHFIEIAQVGMAYGEVPNDVRIAPVFDAHERFDDELAASKPGVA